MGEAVHAGLAVGIGPLFDDERGVEARARLVRGVDVDAVTVSAAEPGLRPRELSRSARRDVAAQLRRGGVRCVGVELWIPSRHFADAVRVDGAVEAMLGAVELASELAPLTDGVAALHTALPGAHAEGGASVRTSAGDRVVEHALSLGVTVIDHGVVGVSADGKDAGVDVGVDAATELLRGGDPAGVVLGHSSRVGAVRVGDAAGGSRVRLGSGELDLGALVIAWSMLKTGAPLVLDMRGVARPASRVGESIEMIAGLMPPAL